MGMAPFHVCISFLTGCFVQLSDRKSQDGILPSPSPRDWELSISQALRGDGFSPVDWPTETGMAVS